MYSLVITQDYKQIKKHPERISNIEPFINKYNWKGINFPPQSKDWKTFESNHKSIALNVLYVAHNVKGICLAYKSKFNLTRPNEVILLMITDGKKWHYLAVTKLSALLKGTTSKHKGDFYCLNCFHCFHCFHDKTLQDFDRITSYLYRTSVGRVCKTQLLNNVIL